ncbi:hypothetical protein FHY06_000130 [Variovorax sp. BK613]|nr:hypothetical protein [Variovorax sp. BK613]
MSTIDANGMLIDPKVILRRSPGIEHGTLSGVAAIVVHQTDSPTAESSLNGFQVGGNGAHFLIDKNGQIYQTASVIARCYHVGKLIKSKCLTIDRSTCDTGPWPGCWRCLGSARSTRSTRTSARSPTRTAIR